jgi:predicted ATP-grasp superfamily ATP-dependent carboligase
MKLLVFEFITGGGFSQQELPESLLKEGRLMLDALMTDLLYLDSLQLTLLLDWRCTELDIPDKVHVIWVLESQNVYDLLPDLIESVDFMWPIAPEIDQALKKISTLIESKGKRLLNSSAEAVEICSDKLLTFQVLNGRGLAVVKTTQLDDFTEETVGQWVIKPKDGAGCLNSYFLNDQHDIDRIRVHISQPEDYIIQPYIEGEVLSLSCLFKEGKAELICCNRQQVSIKNGMFTLDVCEVNISTNKTMVYQTLIDDVVQSIAGLWGYVGIDIIEPKFSSPIILEINARLTTSYVGIYPATGFNIGRAVIDMLEREPKIQKAKALQYNIRLN